MTQDCELINYTNIGVSRLQENNPVDDINALNLYNMNERWYCTSNGDKELIVNTRGLPAGWVDTDREDIRVARNQRELELYTAPPFWEKDDGSKIGMRERLFFIRSYLFGELRNVKGESIISVRKNPEIYVYIPGDEFEFLPSEFVPYIFETFLDRIDKVYEVICGLDRDQRYDAVMRFAATVYSLGMLLHPYIDGNGQTFRVLAYSYIKELLDDIEVSDRITKGYVFPSVTQFFYSDEKQSNLDNNDILIDLLIEGLESIRIQTLLSAQSWRILNQLANLRRFLSFWIDDVYVLEEYILWSKRSECNEFIIGNTIFGGIENQMREYYRKS